MIRKAQLKELVGHIVRGVLAEMGSADAVSSSSAMGAPLDIGAASEMSPVMQQKIAREKKIAAQKKVKADQQMLKKVDNDVKSLKTSYDTTRRLTRPNLKKQIDAQKKAISLS